MKNNILITGGNGLVGKTLQKYLPEGIYISSKDYDLRKESEIIKMYEKYKPKIVIHLAAKVGGIMDNILHPADFFTDNVLMNTLLVDYAKKYDVNRFIGILSTCIYPDKVDNYPLTEDMIFLGPPPETNFSYAYAKRSLAVQIESYNKQYGTKYQYLIPCNLYGENDKEDVIKSHFITSLLYKIKKAKINNEDFITIYGDGTPLRQFMYVDDLCKIIKMTIEEEVYDSFNVTCDENYSIKEMVDIALDSCGSKDLKVIYDKDKPNGQHRKDASNGKLKKIFPDFNFTKLKDGIKNVYNKI